MVRNYPTGTEGHAVEMAVPDGPSTQEQQTDPAEFWKDIMRWPRM